MIGKRTRERAALLVISDGADTASDTSVGEVRTSLLRSDAFVYAIAIDSPKRQAINTRVNAAALGEITGQSGGRTEVVQDMEGLHAATARIAEELNSQYVMAYASPRATDGKYHSIRVRVTRPGLQGARAERVRRRGEATGRESDVIRLPDGSGMASDKRFLSDRFPRSSQYHPDWIVASVSGGRELAVADRVAHDRAGPAARHAGAGPRLRPGGVVDLPAPRVRRAGVGDRPVVQRLGEPRSASAMPASRTASSRSTPMPGRCRSPTSSSTPSCPSIRSSTTGPTTCT